MPLSLKRELPDGANRARHSFCEYQTAPSMSWHPSLYSASVVSRLILTQFSEYVAGVQKADCEADLKRRLNKDRVEGRFRYRS